MRTSKKSEILLELLCKDENCFCTYESLARQLNLSSRQLYRILCSLQEKGFVKIEKCLSNQRKHLVSIMEGIKMARLRKRETIAPTIDREEMISGIKRKTNRRTKKEVVLDPIMIPKSVLKILDHWNSIEHVPKLRIPKLVDGLYPNPTNLLKNTVSQLRKVLTGNFFGQHRGAAIIQLGEKNRIFTIDEINLSIDRYCIAAYCTNHYPFNKCYLKNKNLSTILFDEQASSLMGYSLLMHFFENEPELTPVAKAQIHKLEKERAEGIKIKAIKRDEFSLMLLTEELMKVYNDAYGIDDEKEEKELKKVAMVLYDFAEEHGGTEHQIRQWAWYAVGALKWRKEKGGNFKAIPRTMLQDWFYDDVLIGYLKDKQIDGFIYLPEFAGENTTTRDDRLMTEEEARELFPMMFKLG